MGKAASKAAKALTPPRPKKKRQRLESPEEAEESTDNPYGRISALERRVITCVLVVDGGMSTRKACEQTGVARSKFLKFRWIERYKEHGMRALIEENRGGSVAWALTPLSKEAAKRLASEGFNANDMREKGYDTEYM